MLDLFKKKQNENEFIFVGNRRHLRTEEELMCVNKEEADSAFKRYKKEFIDKLLVAEGFYKYKTNAYVRLNSIGLLEYIDLQKERYGSKTFCVNFAVMPLYCKRDYIVLSLGDRLGSFISGEDVWWDYASESVAKESFTNVSTAIEKYLLAWFEQFSTTDGYRDALKKMHNKKLADEWLDAMENVHDKEIFIRQGIEKLKLPKKMQT